MTASLAAGRVASFDAVILENPRLRAVILPALGGRIWELEDRVRGRQWIWHRGDVPLAVSRVGDVYDEVWAGGWEELFPNDAPGAFEGRDLPDHGEWWTRPWTVAESSTGGGAARLTLTTRSSIIRASCTKEVVLADDAASLSVQYTIRSLEPQAFHYLFKQHLPIQLTAGCLLRLPGGRMEAVDPSFGTMLPDGGPFEWPVAANDSGGTVDMQLVPEPSAAAREFLYVRDLPEGWCGVDDTRCGASLRMHFDRDAMPFVWLFLSYGGWRDVYTAVLEPCTNMPKDLVEAVGLQQSARLDPADVFTTTVSITLGALGVAGE